MPTNRERILMVARGEMADVLPYVPRIDLWYNANSIAGTLPEKYTGSTQDEISKAEGWALHKIIPEYLKVDRPEDTIHRALGIYYLKELVFECKFSGDVETEVCCEDNLTHVVYHTPVGKVSTTTEYTDEMKKAGASITWIKERAIKGREDYRVLSHIFENLQVVPTYDRFIEWMKYVGDDGIAATPACGQLAACPMHHIQKDFLGATEFYLHYHDYYKEMRSLAKSMERFYNRALEIIADSPAEAVIWGGNFDEMITYPAYFKKEILPWIRKIADVLEAKNKVLICHCDGENFGLMDLIRDSGIHVAEAVTPYPMTKVKIEEYYERWAHKLTIFGGIPESLLLKETTSDEEFETYLDHLFRAVVPGKRFIVGIGDTTPAHAVFERLVRIGERIQREGRLPIEGGAARPLQGAQVVAPKVRLSPKFVEDADFRIIQEDILKGEHLGIKDHVSEMLNSGIDPQDILQRGMISAMELISERFKAGSVFLPEVLLSGRAMNEGLLVLEPYLAKSKKKWRGKVLIATVRGDLHDIGKNIVISMLRGAGFEIKDLGVDVSKEVIVEIVSEFRPDILGLSALLTTAMPEMEKVIKELESRGLRRKLKVVVGGAPLNQRFADRIGADGYAPDAGEAVDLANQLLKD